MEGGNWNTFYSLEFAFVVVTKLANNQCIDGLFIAYETWEKDRGRQVKESEQGQPWSSDQEKAISMAQAFKLLILIFSIIGLVVNHLAITPVKSWHHYIQTITVVFTRFWHCTMHMSHLFLIWEFDKVLLVPALQNTSWSRLKMLLRTAEMLLRRMEQTNIVRGRSYVNFVISNPETSLFYVDTQYTSDSQLPLRWRTARRTRSGKKVANRAPANLMERRWSAMASSVPRLLSKCCIIHIKHIKQLGLPMAPWRFWSPHWP